MFETGTDWSADMSTGMTRRELLAMLGLTAAACRAGAPDRQRQNAEAATVTLTVSGMI